MPTIYDVATLAGVSPATVSRVFGGGSVSDEKRRIVQQAAKTLKYTPDSTARALRRRVSDLLALVIPDIANPHFTEIARGVEDVAQEAGYSVVLCNTDSEVRKEQRYLQVMVSENIAGVIIAPAAADTDVNELLNLHRPVVAIDRQLEADVDGVMIDNRVCGAVATRSLFDAGYERIACITGPQDISTAADRAAGWRSVVGRRGTYDADPYLRHVSYQIDGGRAAAAELMALPEPPDAILACNNMIGVGALQVLAERDLVPYTVGVAVIGHLPYTTLPADAATVVALPARRVGVAAARMLLDRINGDTEPPRTVVLRGELRPGRPRPTT